MAACQKEDAVSRCGLNKIIAQFEELFANLVAVLNERESLALIEVHLFQEQKNQNGNEQRHSDKDNQSCPFTSL